MGTPPSRKHILRVTSATTGHGILRSQLSLSSHPPRAPNHNTEIRFETYEVLPVVSHRAIDAPYYCNRNPILHQTVAKPVCPTTFTSVGRRLPPENLSLLHSTELQPSQSPLLPHNHFNLTPPLFRTTRCSPNFSQQRSAQRP
jgi:hypothetical protein